MIWIVLLKLMTCLLSVMLGAAILARDHELRANRLIAIFLFCNAWWAGLEFLAFRTGYEPNGLLLCRIMSFGWIPLGILCMHASLTLSAMEEHPIARTVPFFYAGVLLMLPLALGTDLVIREVSPADIGWKVRFGPAFAIAYLLLAAPVVAILVCWRDVMSLPGPGGQLQLARIVFFGISSALVSGTFTAVLFPLLGLPAVGITTSLVALVGIFAGITLQRYGHSLISPQAFAREILDTLEDGVVLIGAGGTVRDANRAFLRMVGARETQVIGRPIRDWIPDFAKNDASSQTSPLLLDMRTMTSEPVPIVVSTPVACHGSRRLVGRAYLIRDRRQMVSLQRQLIVSARLAAVGDLSRSISRSIEEPVEHSRIDLEALSVDWRALARELEERGLEAELGEAANEGLELIDECLEGVDRISSIVQEVGRFSAERSCNEMEIHALDEIVRQSIRIAEAQAPPTLDIEVDLESDIFILGHRSQIERVVTNLIVNAIQAFDGPPPAVGRLTITMVGRGDRAFLQIEDDGCGIDGDTLDRIFDPFFTTKPVGKGTGLGLPISYHIVKEHRGEIRVSSTAGRGTQFTVVLPRVGPATPVVASTTESKTR